jgi:hypothetical protein
MSMNKWAGGLLVRRWAVVRGYENIDMEGYEQAERKEMR